MINIKCKQVFLIILIHGMQTLHQKKVICVGVPPVVPLKLAVVVYRCMFVASIGSDSITSNDRWTSLLVRCFNRH